MLCQIFQFFSPVLVPVRASPVPSSPKFFSPLALSWTFLTHSSAPLLSPDGPRSAVNHHSRASCARAHAGAACDASAGDLSHETHGTPMRVVPTPAASPQVTEAPPAPPAFNVKDLPGISGPLGFFDPLGVVSPLCTPCAALSRRLPRSRRLLDRRVRGQDQVLPRGGAEARTRRHARLARCGRLPLSTPAAAARF